MRVKIAFQVKISWFSDPKRYLPICYYAEKKETIAGLMLWKSS